MEQSFVAWAKMRARNLPQVKLGIGDDAAILQAEQEDVVITCDTMMEGVHFRSDITELRRIGRKLVHINLSDLAAMAAIPKALFLSLCVPNNSPNRAADVIAAEIFEAVCQAAEEHQVAVAGGDTNCWGGPLVLSLTAVGYTEGGLAWTRSGARPDDLVVVTGPLGGSISGKHLDFQPRLDVAEALRGKLEVHACMDISDGLSTDLLRMCDASNCGAILDLSKVPITEAAQQLANTSGRTPVEHALGDGEDFELLLAISPDDYPRMVDLLGPQQAIVCGEFTSRTGLWMREGGKILQLAASGFVHR
ncbi:MAG: thiamine-phosphate kinase [bacterium]|nr:thiamine-phosphate kinase [bacterium]